MPVIDEATYAALGFTPEQIKTLKALDALQPTAPTEMFNPTPAAPVVPTPETKKADLIAKGVPESSVDDSTGELKGKDLLNASLTGLEHFAVSALLHDLQKAVAWLHLKVNGV